VAKEKGTENLFIVQQYHCKNVLSYNNYLEKISPLIRVHSHYLVNYYGIFFGDKAE